MTEIAVALITLAGVIITVVYGNKKNHSAIQETTNTVKAQTELTIYRIEQLEKKQDIHNGVIERVYKLEEDVSVLNEKAKVNNNRIKDLAAYHKPHNN